ncbi:hypothetical protein HC028_10380 [Planosporangium flavigriseum]|uniref:Uncharacterized protein n=1 Tax=Planosporangium flavigriseum TaxID=373681 RepID=A0A8J3LXA4_9ACTN|nr:hypothetical protein [Planosporangium flavigriseum]NJC64905.1 hypothetical protein [Planosporangium flavigriseum]GIG72780.1 hypothetical protein Pfl04_11840 [Planosporangium flavigriseum]
MAATRAGLAPGAAAQPGRVTGTEPASVRPVASRATALMVATAGAALTDLVWAFTPLASVWSVHEAAARGGQLPGAVLLASNVGVLALMAVTHVTAWALLAGWLLRAEANARVLAPGQRPPRRTAEVWFAPASVAGAVARASRCRRPAALVWSWWLAWLAGAAALLAGTALTWPSELRAMLVRVWGGATVDVDRAGELLGYQIAGRLPGAVLLLAAAVLGVVAVDRVTTAQYDRFDELRSSECPPSEQMARSRT